MKKVLIVKEGQWGSVKPEEYEIFIETIRDVIEEAETVTLFGSKEKAAKVEVVDTAQEAEKVLEKEGADVVVFVSRGMDHAAERLSILYPKTRIIAFTGLIPDRKVIWVRKSWLNHELIQDVILH